jgi:hypothetical protein
VLDAVADVGVLDGVTDELVGAVTPLLVEVPVAEPVGDTVGLADEVADAAPLGSEVGEGVTTADEVGGSTLCDGSDGGTRWRAFGTLPDISDTGDIEIVGAVDGGGVVETVSPPCTVSVMTLMMPIPAWF